MYFFVLCFYFMFTYSAVAGSPANVNVNDKTSRQVRQDMPPNKKMSLEELKELCGFKMSDTVNQTRNSGMSPLPGIRVMACEDTSCLPKNFSWLTEKNFLEKCPSLGHIRNQKCMDCWAVSAAAVLSDRYCLLTNERRYFSAKQLCACASRNGCSGGDPKVAMSYFVTEGVVSGGDPSLIAQPKGCQPYPVEKNPQLTCENQCDTSADMVFDKDKKNGSSTYALTKKDVKEIQLDLMRYGPLVATFKIFEDFNEYTSGIYEHKKGNPLGHHAIRMVGWGEENGKLFWILANSFGEDWGENGFLRIARGANECGIEEYLVGVDTKGQHTPIPDASTQPPTSPTPPSTSAIPEKTHRTVPYIPASKLCSVIDKNTISYAYVHANSGIIIGNSNVICKNSGTIDGTNNIICENSGSVIGSSNMICGSNNATPTPTNLTECDKNGMKECDSCNTDPELKC